MDAWQQVRIAGDLLRIPPGTALDLGATGKAWAADLIGSACEQEGLGAAVVSVGGDVRVVAPDGRPWQVAVTEHPGAPAEALVTIEAGGLATSTTRVRRWARAGRASPPPARPPHRAADAGAVAHRDRHRRHLRRRQHRHHGGGGARRGRARWLGSRACPPAWWAADGCVVTLGGWPADEVAA